MTGWSGGGSWPVWTSAVVLTAGAAAYAWARARMRKRGTPSAPAYQLELLHSLYRNSPVAFAVVDRLGRFLDVNRDPVQLFGYSKEEMSGLPFTRFIDADSLPTAMRMFHGTLDGDNSAEDIRILHKDGHPMDLHITASPMLRRGRTSALVVFFQDISERTRSLERIHHMAYYDDMTGLPNRRFFMNRLDEKLKDRLDSRLHPAICCLDVDGFKLVNTSFGRDFGDMLILQIAERLIRCLALPGDLARLEGDEFAGYLGEVRDPEEAGAKAEQMMRVLEEPFELGGVPVYLSVSIGVAVYAGEEDAVTLLKKADTALQRAKENGKNEYLLHTEEMDPIGLHKLTIQHELRKGLANGEFVLYYQPQYDLASGQIVGMEALIRWNHPERGFVSPGEFIPAAEDSGIIVPLGDWVLEEACRQNKRWQEMGMPTIPVSVNLSVRQFFRRDVTAKVAEVLAQTGLEPRYLELEITESMTMDVERASQYLQELTALGVQIAIDDFGTGYSSFHYLKSLPIARLKIDRSFVRDIQQDPGDAAIVAAIIAMAHNLQLQVIAEGVETEAQMDFLRSHGCDEMQGFFGSPPLPSAGAQKLLAEKRHSFALPHRTIRSQVAES